MDYTIGSKVEVKLAGEYRDGGTIEQIDRDGTVHVSFPDIDWCIPMDPARIVDVYDI